MALTSCAFGQAQQEPPAPAPQKLPPAVPDNQRVDGNQPQENAVAKVKVKPEEWARQAIDAPIFEPDMQGVALATLYEKLTGKRVIMSREAMTSTISAFIKPPVTNAGAAVVLEKSAMLEGLVFIPSGPNEVKLVKAANSNRQGIPVVTRAAEIPEGEKVITYVMSFDHISAEDGLKVFNTLVRTFNPQGIITPVANTSTLLITENSALVRTLLKIKEEIDLPQELFTNLSIELSHGDAEEVAASVQTILDFTSGQNVLSSSTGGNNNQNTRNNNNGNNNRNNNRNNNNQRTAGSEGSVLLTAMSSNNRIHITGRPIEVRYAESLIRDFDSPSRSQNYIRHKLHFLAVSDFLPIASDAINRTTNRIAEQGGGNQAGGRNTGNNNAAGANAQGGGENGTVLSDGDRLEYPESLLIGKTLLVADNANNALIVQGPPQSIGIIKDLINEMDIASEQVQITAVFGRYSVTDDLDFGVDFARTYQATRGSNSGFAIGNSTGYPVLVDPTTLTDGAALNAASVAGLSIYGKIGNHFLPTLRAMQSDGKFKLVSRPSVFTTNNRKAVLSSGQSIAVPTNTLSQNVNGANGLSQSTNIEFRDVLLKLEVVPLVNSDDEVTLKISFVNDTIVGSQTIDGNSIPTIGKEELVTTVTVPNNGTIVLGGLITERDQDDKDGVPILSSIPGIGRLFSTTTKSKLREELVIFIQPRIVSRDGDLEKLQKYNRSKSQLARDIQGESAGVLPKLPSREKEKQPDGGKDVVPLGNPKDGRYRGIRR